MTINTFFKVCFTTIENIFTDGTFYISTGAFIYRQRERPVKVNKLLPALLHV